MSICKERTTRKHKPHAFALTCNFPKLEANAISNSEESHVIFLVTSNSYSNFYDTWYANFGATQQRMIAQRDFYAHYETLSQLQTMFLVDDGQQQALGINFHMFNGKEKKISW